MRWIAPEREAVDRSVFDHPVFAEYAVYRDWLTSSVWPDVDTLNARWNGYTHPISGQPLRFVAQSPELLADGLHYEARIFERGLIATREHSWHDLFNAMVWIQHGALKAALNKRQIADIERAGGKNRTRGQCALTHFDEAGVIVVCRDPALFNLWNSHDWRALFWENRHAWRSLTAIGADTAASPIQLLIFGHALLEHGLKPHQLMVAKAIAVLADNCVSLEKKVAEAIVQEQLLTDPQELRPLPLSGIPGWHAGTVDASFYTLGPCFRPLRADRAYPPPFRLR